MSQAPSMPLFVDAYLADTTHLSLEEHGAYLLVLMAMWRRGGSIPDDDKDTARILGTSPAKWKRMKERFRPFFDFSDGFITQKRLKKEWDYVQQKSQTQRENAAKRWGGHSNENSDLGDATASSPHKPPHKPEHKPNGMPERCPQSHTHPQGKDSREFEEFWNLYPRKVGKDAARRAFKSALKRTDHQSILAGVKRYAKARHGQDPKFTAHPATWLNAGRWSDDDAAEQHEANKPETFGGIAIREV